MNNIIFLLKNKLIFNLCIFKIKIKYNKFLQKIYLKGFFGLLSINFFIKKNLYIYYIKQKLLFFWRILNIGWIGYLYLNGIGFKATKKLFLNKKKFWRFNIGHSHVFKYFTPQNIIMKVKTRNIFIFGIYKMQIMDILKKIKVFRLPDFYKGIGIKYPNELIKLKKGKVRQ